MGLEQALQYGLLGAVGGGAKVIQDQEKADRENAAKRADDSARSERDLAIEERRAALNNANQKDLANLNHANRLEEIRAQGAAQSKAARDPTEDESKKFKLQQEKRKDAAIQEWTNLAEQYDSAADEQTKQYLYPLLQKAEIKLSSLGINPRGTTSVDSAVNPLSGEVETKASVKTGIKTSPPSAGKQQDKFIIGKQYRDANGNVATYRGNGQWE